MNIDLFAGVGGWAQAGVTDFLGIELDPHAVAAHVAAHGQHSVMEADVRFVSPSRVRAGQWVEGLVASPPTQTFSRTGANSGHSAIPALCDALKHIAVGHRMRSVVKAHGIERQDDRTLAILEPMRWIYDLDRGGQKLVWVALEHAVATVPVLETYAALLSERGFSCWVGKLNAWDYGVAQMRERAVLLASRLTAVGRPRPVTHRPAMREVLSSEDLLPTSKLIPGSWVGASARSRQPTGLHLPCPPLAFGKDFNWRWDQPARDVTLEELSVIQGFPADFPWAGGKVSSWGQVAASIPPPLAAAILRVVADT